MADLSTLKKHLRRTTSSSMILLTAGASISYRPFFKNRTMRWRFQLKRLKWLDRLRKANKISPWSRRVPKRVKTTTLLWWLPRYETKSLSFLETTTRPFFSSMLFNFQSELNHFLIALATRNWHRLSDFQAQPLFKIRTQVLLRVSELRNKLNELS